MSNVSANRFCEHLDHEVDRTIANHEVLRVHRDGGADFVVLGSDDWRAIEESLLLNGVPGLADSIRAAAAEPIEEGTALRDLEW